MAKPTFLHEDKIDRRVAQIFEVAVSQMLSREDMEGLASRLRLEEHMDREMRRLIWTLRASVCGKDKVDTYYKYFRWPENWWEAVKERWFPEFLLRRHPVKYHNETVVSSYHHTKLCPHLSLGTERDHIEWLFLDFEPYDYKAPDQETSST
jgi:hypothetical protein